MNILANAIARLAAADGLHAVYVPDHLDDLARNVVREANRLRTTEGDEPPFAILIDERDPEDETDKSCKRLSVGGAIKYRKGNRLAVVNGHQPVTASFTSSYANVPMESDYPGVGADRGSRLEMLGEAALSALLDDVNPEARRHVDQATEAKRLNAAFGALADAHEGLRQGTEPWNTFWLRHLDSGLRILHRTIHHSTDALDDVLRRYTYAAFGLPRPKDGSGYARTRKVHEALIDHWGSQDAIRVSLDQLINHPSRESEGGSPHPVSKLPFEDFGSRAVVAGSPMMAWGTPGSEQDPDIWVEALAELTELQFFSPDQALGQALVPRAPTGEPLAILEESGPCVVVFAWADGDSGLQSELISVMIPSGPVPPDLALETSKLDISVSGKGTWSGALEVHEGELHAVGTIGLPVGAKGSMPSRPVTLSVKLPPGDVLAGLVGTPSSPPLYPVIAGTVGIWEFEAKSKKGAYKAGSHRGYPTLQEATMDSGERVDVDSREEAALLIIAWGGEPGGLPETQVVRTDQDTPIYVTSQDFKVVGDPEVTVGNLAVRWAGAHQGAEYLSPLVAAALDGVVSQVEPDAATLSSVRGRIEDFLTTAVAEGAEELIEAHGHLAIFEASPELPEAFQPTCEGAVLVPPGVGEDLAQHTNFSVSSKLRSSHEARRFRAAIEGLNLGQRMLQRGRKNDIPTLMWPSRTSWASLYGTTELDEYLEAYAELMARAEEDGNSRDQFWAAFPFSLTVYERSGGADARAVLLTPLHPLRLAWLANAQTALESGVGSNLLAGLLESWNLPLVGPQPDSKNGRLLAVPADAGTGQLFTGWSALVRVSVAGRQNVVPPSTIGPLPSPGSSMTGLNADSVRAALATFQRMNPHVATLSVDLSASTAGPRLDEIDRAVVDIITGNAKSLAPVRGGVLVHDSLNRLGDPPLDELERQLDQRSGRPVRWSRYIDGGSSGIRSNLRFLQDAGIKVEVSQTSKPGHGLLGDMPLRRLSVPSASDEGGAVALSYPGVPHDAGASAFARALGALERSATGVQVSVELFKAAILSSQADWTVTGESMLGASALAEMLAHGRSGQMLWEWRPPYLSGRGTARLDSRPFISVVRLPRAFRTQVAHAVGKAAGDPGVDSSDSRVEGVLNTLGARGIGLSTLMAQGGTHAAGAIGFYLAIRLLEMATVPDAELLVLPIDACDEFLRALAGADASKNELRRADLLVVALRQGSITLVPVEIKSYGLTSANPDRFLPSGEGQLKDPLGQLESTSALLRQVVDAFAKLRAQDAGAASLWRHGLATMLEAGMRLRPDPAAGGPLLMDTLAGVLDGDLDVRLGRSLLCYFGHEATTKQGEEWEVQGGLQPPGDSSSPLAGALVSRTQTAFSAATDEGHALHDSWAGLLSWALDSASDAVEASAAGLTVDVTAPEPSDEVHSASDPYEASDMDPPGRMDVGFRPTAPPAVSRRRGTQTPDIAAPTEALVLESEELNPGVRFPIGQFVDSSQQVPVDFWPGNTRLNQLNVGVVGDLGTGKTQFLKAVLWQLRKGARETQPNPLSMLVFDYKRDYQDEAFLTSVGGHLLRPFRIPLDVLAVNGEYTPQKAVQAASAFVDILAKIYKGIGPIQRNNLLVIIKGMFESSGGVAPTLGEILDAYQEDNGVDSVVSILNGFVLNEVFSEDRSELISMEELLDDRVLVLAVSDLGADDQLKTALITLFLNKYYEYMLRLPKWPYSGQAPEQIRRLNSFVLVDEATNIMKHEFPVLEQLLLQGREFGVGVVLASQYVSHFKVGGTNYGETLLTKVVHKVPSTNEKELKAFGFSTATGDIAARVAQLPNHHALVKTLGVESRFMRGAPYFELDHSEDVRAPEKAAIMRHSGVMQR